MESITFCMRTVTEVKHIQVFPDQKRWMTTEVRLLQKGRESAFRSGNKDLSRTARADLRRGIRKAKLDYQRQIEDHLSNSKPRQVWEGLQHLSNFRGQTSTEAHSSAALEEERSAFLSRFQTTPLQSYFIFEVRPHFVFNGRPSSSTVEVKVAKVTLHRSDTFLF